MKPLTLDHIALYVRDRDRLATLLTDELGLVVLDRTDRYTLIGPGATEGKLTLFEAPVGATGLNAGRIVSIMLADRAGSGRSPIRLEDGFTLTFGTHDLVTADVSQHAVVGITMRSDDPGAAAREYVERYGFSELASHGDVATIGSGTGVVSLVRESVDDAAGTSALFHLGMLVDSARRHIDEAAERGIEVVNVVDAPNTYAVFVNGPEGTCIEYVEHKKSFALS